MKKKKNFRSNNVMELVTIEPFQSNNDTFCCTFIALIIDNQVYFEEVLTAVREWDQNNEPNYIPYS